MFKVVKRGERQRKGTEREKSRAGELEKAKTGKEIIFKELSIKEKEVSIAIAASNLAEMSKTKPTRQ